MAGKGRSSPTDAARAARPLPAFVSLAASGTVLAMCAEVNVHESRNYVSPQTLLSFNPHPHPSTEREREREREGERERERERERGRERERERGRGGERERERLNFISQR